eukprot:jgi/Mesvir1/5575/Mv15595-RA.1
MEQMLKLMTQSAVAPGAANPTAGNGSIAGVACKNPPSTPMPKAEPASSGNPVSATPAASSASSMQSPTATSIRKTSELPGASTGPSSGFASRPVGRGGGRGMAFQRPMASSMFVPRSVALNAGRTRRGGFASAVPRPVKEAPDTSYTGGGPASTPATGAESVRPPTGLTSPTTLALAMAGLYNLPEPLGQIHIPMLPSDEHFGPPPRVAAPAAPEDATLPQDVPPPPWGLVPFYRPAAMSMHHVIIRVRYQFQRAWTDPIVQTGQFAYPDDVTVDAVQGVYFYRQVPGLEHPAHLEIITQLEPLRPAPVRPLVTNDDPDVRVTPDLGRTWRISLDSLGSCGSTPRTANDIASETSDTCHVPESNCSRYCTHLRWCVV